MTLDAKVPTGPIEKKWDQHPIEEWAQSSPRLTDAERGLPNDSSHSVNLHCRNDFPCRV